jgi:hypothetical protein
MKDTSQPGSTPATKYKIINHTELRDEMRAVARGEKPAPDYAGQQTFESAEVLAHWLSTRGQQEQDADGAGVGAVDTRPKSLV